MLQSTLSGSSVPGLGGRERVIASGIPYCTRTSTSTSTGDVRRVLVLVLVQYSGRTRTRTRTRTFAEDRIFNVWYALQVRYLYVGSKQL